jgi:hypothetical protein
LNAKQAICALLLRTMLTQMQQRFAIAQGASLYLTYPYPVSAHISELDAFQTIGCFRTTAASQSWG